MADVFTSEKRSWIMGRVKGRDTKPEMLVRSMIHRMGFRFKLHDRTLPGNPDIVMVRDRKIVFVHGCFWHGHADCPRSVRPTSNESFWNKKLDSNIERDKRNLRALRELDWTTLVVWECETKRPERLLQKLERFLKKGSSYN